MKTSAVAISWFALLLATGVAGATPLEPCPGEPDPVIKTLETANRLTARITSCEAEESRVRKSAQKVYDSFFGRTRKVKGTVLGLTLEGSKEELVLAREILGGQPSNSWKQRVSRCKTAICALKAAYGDEEIALRALTIAKRDGYVLAVGTDRAWQLEEVRALDRLLSAAPPQLRNIPGLRYFHRLPKSEHRQQGTRKAAAGQATPAIPSAGITGSIAFYDLAFSDEGESAFLRDWSTEVAVHEFCHHLDFQGVYSEKGVPYSEQKNWEFAEKSWSQDQQGTWRLKSDQQLVSGYAAEDVGEDFAESCAAYLLDPARLASASSEKYAIMKAGLFAGREFLPEGILPGKAWAPLVALHASAAEICAAPLRDCLPSLHRLSDSWRELVAEPGSETKKAAFHANSEEAWRNSRCLKEAKGEIRKNLIIRLSTHPEYCQAEGEHHIAAHAAHFCMQWLEMNAPRVGVRSPTSSSRP